MIKKTVYLIIAKFKNMIIEDKFFFFVFTIGVITCNLMFTYGYGILMQLNERDGSDDFYLYNMDSPLGISQIENELINYSAEIYYYLPLEEEHCSLLTADDSQVDIRFIRTGSNIFDTYVVTGKIDGLKQIGTVIVPNSIKGIGIGDKIVLNGYDFLVVGSSISDDFEISIETFESCGFKPNSFSVDVPYRQVDKLGNTLHMVFENKYNYAVNEAKGAGLDDSSKSSLLVIAAIYALCALSFIYLMISIYDDAASELSIYEIIGATRLRIIIVIGGVMLILISFISFISQIIHAAFYDAFFKKLNIAGNYIYTFDDYLTVFFTTLITVYAVVLLYIIIRTHKSTIVNLRKFIK